MKYPLCGSALLASAAEEREARCCHRASFAFGILRSATYQNVPLMPKFQFAP